MNLVISFKILHYIPLKELFETFKPLESLTCIKACYSGKRCNFPNIPTLNVSLLTLKQSTNKLDV